jgi:hypothetical protein
MSEPLNPLIAVVEEAQELWVLRGEGAGGGGSQRRGARARELPQRLKGLKGLWGLQRLKLAEQLAEPPRADQAALLGGGAGLGSALFCALKV